jgi:hypothetical protein
MDTFTLKGSFLIVDEKIFYFEGVKCSFAFILKQMVVA